MSAGQGLKRSYEATPGQGDGHFQTELQVNNAPAGNPREDQPRDL